LSFGLSGMIWILVTALLLLLLLGGFAPAKKAKQGPYHIISPGLVTGRDHPTQQLLSHKVDDASHVVTMLAAAPTAVPDLEWFLIYQAE